MVGQVLVCEPSIWTWAYVNGSFDRLVCSHLVVEPANGSKFNNLFVEVLPHLGSIQDGQTLDPCSEDARSE